MHPLALPAYTPHCQEKLRPQWAGKVHELIYCSDCSGADAPYHALQQLAECVSRLNFIQLRLQLRHCSAPRLPKNTALTRCWTKTRSRCVYFRTCTFGRPPKTTAKGTWQDPLSTHMAQRALDLMGRVVLNWRFHQISIFTWLASNAKTSAGPTETEVLSSSDRISYNQVWLRITGAALGQPW